MKVEFRPTEPLTPIDPSVFEIVRAQYELIETVHDDVIQAVWPKFKYFAELKASLEPVVARLEEIDGKAPDLAYIDVISCTAEPGQPFVSNWARNWHVDRPRFGANCEVGLASMQPTESLHGSFDDVLLADDDVQTGLALISHLTDIELVEQQGLTISQGMPAHAIEYDENTPHRAAINSAEDLVTRELMIAGFYRYQGSQGDS